MLRCLSLIFVLLSGPAFAQALEQMQGQWTGSGWARETLSSPREVVRCRLKNTYEAGVLALKGRCVAAGRKLTLSGEMHSKGSSERITGHWFNPDGLGSVRITGAQSQSAVAFTLQANDPDTGAKLTRKITWRVTSDGLDFRASDPAGPNAIMSEITFKH